MTAGTRDVWLCMCELILALCSHPRLIMFLFCIITPNTRRLQHSRRYPMISAHLQPSQPTHLRSTRSRRSLVSRTSLDTQAIKLIARSETLPAVTLEDEIEVSATLITSTSYTCSNCGGLTAIKCNQSAHHTRQLAMNVLTSKTALISIPLTPKRQYSKNGWRVINLEVTSNSLSVYICMLHSTNMCISRPMFQTKNLTATNACKLIGNYI